MIEKPKSTVEELLSSLFIAQLPGGVILAVHTLSFSPIFQLICFPLVLGCIATCIYSIYTEVLEVRAYNKEQTKKMKQDKTIKITVLDESNGVLVLTGTAEPDISITRTIDFDADDHTEGDYVMKAIGNIANLVSEHVKADPEKYPDWQSIGNLKLDVTITDTVEV